MRSFALFFSRLLSARAIQRTGMRFANDFTPGMAIYSANKSVRVGKRTTWKWLSEDGISTGHRLHEAEHNQ